MKSSVRLTVILAVLAASAACTIYARPQERVIRVGHGIRDNIEQYYDYMIMAEAFRRAGYVMKVTQAPFSRILYMAKNGELDAVCNTLLTEERQQYLNYPRTSLVEYRQTFFRLKGTVFSFDGDFSKLKGTLIGVIRGFSYGASFDDRVKSGEIRTAEAADTRQLARMLMNGRVSVIIENPIALAYETRNIDGFWMNIREEKLPVSTQQAYVAFTKRSAISAEAMAAFDSALASMKSDGSYDRIMAQALKRN